MVWSYMAHRAGPTKGGMPPEFWGNRTGAMQVSGYEFPRIPLLGRWLNKAKGKGGGEWMYQHFKRWMH
jgi:hypothetical protein